MEWGRYHHKNYTLPNCKHQHAILQAAKYENYKDMLMLLGFPEEMY